MNTYHINIGKDHAEARIRLLMAGWEEIDKIEERFRKHSIGLDYETERIATLGEDGMVELEVIEQ